MAVMPSNVFARHHYKQLRTSSGVTVDLINTDGSIFYLQGFSTTQPVTLQPNADWGYIGKVRIRVTEAAGQVGSSDLQTDFRCELRDAGQNNNRIIVTRDNSIDFNFGVGKAWKLQPGGPVKASNLRVKCDPALRKIELDRRDDIRVALSNSAQEFERQLDFSDSEGRQEQRQSVGGTFTHVELFVGPGVENQALRCKALNGGQVVLLNRGVNLNKQTFGDGGNGRWTVAGGPTEIDEATEMETISTRSPIQYYSGSGQVNRPIAQNDQCTSWPFPSFAHTDCLPNKLLDKMPRTARTSTEQIKL
ncbi:uncharacterized protein B0I36DRAFT_356839 [Microdochium trichocladiopsis]|uniref:Uncharacterized protein n=1 Tax=Microdochium trichocladiopsis TaxID=1682393 RepID=A0A9P8XP64_9PEZI|nr:uncharacterized protein B0I36DRAFT_356839 [Microdochium trichocladiopsis]KAH7009118.1 hypothetical protein B0I36DRAFT_356839 [Microdochium trichocladiopsis]